MLPNKPGWNRTKASRPAPGLPQRHAGANGFENGEPGLFYDVVGPVCESGDWLAKERALALEQGDLLAILCAGAYGMTMASNYNTRTRPCEVMVDGESAHLIRERERFEDLIVHERIIV